MADISGVYKITCTKNSKVYIGGSKQILFRWKQHINGKHGSYDLHKDIVKYGLNNFQFMVLEECDSATKRNEIERKFMEEYDSLNPDKGYNLQKAPKTAKGPTA